MRAATLIGYLRDFHRRPAAVDGPDHRRGPSRPGPSRRRAGITADVLTGARVAGLGDPYDWAAEAVTDGRVLDLACGSGPLAERLSPARTWAGVDRSDRELARARGRGAKILVQADATRLPFPDGVFGSVLCCMAITDIEPLDDALGELRRVLVADGVGVLVVPGGRPLRATDALRYGRLMVAVHRRGPRYPNEVGTRRLRPRLAKAGLELIGSERRRFVFPLVDPAATRMLVDALSLPGVPPDLIRAAKTAAAAWEGGEIGIPLRRLIVRPVVAATVIRRRRR